MTRLMLVNGILAITQSLAAQTIPMHNVFPLDGVPNYPPEEMIDNVGGLYESAAATVTFDVREDVTFVTFEISDGPPHLLFTVWLKLDAPSPLTGAGVTALAPVWDIESLAIITPDDALTDVAHDLGLVGDDGSGSPDAVNGFVTDADGHALATFSIDTSLVDGAAYPFSTYHHLLPDVTVGTAPFSLRLAAHAADDVAHGLLPGKHEPFFDTVTLGWDCPADANADGMLDILDYVAFQSHWLAADPAADCDASGTFDAIDFVCFQAHFMAGCP